MLSEDDGHRAVRRARAAVSAALADGSSLPVEGPDDDLPPVFREPRGAFVTLKHFPSGELRGCIGYALPILPLATAIAQAAVAAATEDPRFPPVERRELLTLALEVSVLTLPVAVVGTSPEEILRSIRAGRDGLIVDGYGTSGLLLPQVASEMGWTAREFLDGACEKAGLPVGAWRDRGVRIRRFEAEVFGERSPGGPVERIGF